MSTEKRSRDLLGWSLRVLIFVAVALTILLFVLRYEQIRSEGFSAAFFPASQTGETAVRAEVLEFSADAKNVFSVYKKGLIVLSPSGLEVLGNHGEGIESVTKNFGRPTLAVRGGFAVAYDAGGTNMLYLDSAGEVKDLPSAAPIMHASVNAKGSYVLVTEENGAKSTATAYSSKHEELIRWYSSERYILLGDIAPTGDRLAFAGVKQQNARIVSSVVLFSTGSEDPIGSWEILDELILALYFLDDKHILAVCESEAVILDGKNLAELGSYSFNSYTLASCAIGSDFIALRLTGAGVGEVSRIETINFAAEHLATLSISGVVSMSANENFLGVLTTDTLLVYNNALEREAEGSSIGGARHLVLRPGREALIFTTNSAVVYQY